MRKSKLALLFLLIISLALFTTGCETLMSDQPPEDDETENGDVTDPSYFEFEDATGTITGYDDGDGPTDVVIPSEIRGSEVEVIDEGAFEAMDYPLTSVEIPDTVTEIGPQAFRLNELTSVDLGEGVEKIQNEAFRSNSLTEIEFPDSVTFIGEDAFRNNDEVILVEIGEGVNIEGEWTIAGYFKEAYEDHDRSAGVYKRDDENSDWYKE